MAEYEVIKGEQRARIGFRDNLLYATLASMAAVIAVTLQANHRVELLLLLPPVSVLLGWTYLVNDEKISAIGRYVREELAPQLAALTHGQNQVPVFGWEVAHRSDRRRMSRKWLQLAVDLLTFCASPAAAVVVYWAAGQVRAPLLVLSLVELAAIAVLGAQIVLYADLKSSRAAPPG
ncbi:hypothetical protein [Streptomyces gobiensis]|uniref:hypothetical protein n=1 Tax=Streptomyces gobiensis TaxID=2875706 RepID=UPI001E41897A|nr:hypothetical protein [Streptomyces gobiensis]UGY95289.1 hypothetical protein test1122_23960 [Streptomyces gobiensis]